MHCLFYGQILPADRYMSHLGQYVGSLGFTSDDQTGVDVIEGRAFQPYPTVIICIHNPHHQQRFTLHLKKRSSSSIPSQCFTKYRRRRLKNRQRFQLQLKMFNHTHSHTLVD